MSSCSHTCSHMASTHAAHDSPTAHTQPTAARMKPTARHHEYRTTATAGLALSLTDRRPGSRARARCVSVCCLVSVDEGTPLHAVAPNAINLKRRIVRAIYYSYWYNTRFSGRIMCRLAATPAATWPARTQHMTAQQHTQPTAARMKPTARHHEYRTTATAGLALSLTDRRPCSRARARCVSVCCLVSVDEGTPLHAVAPNAINLKRRIVRAIYYSYWYNTRFSGRIMCRLAATPAATWPARTQHMTAQQHTRNQPLHV